MKRNLRLWQLYILPLLVVGALLTYEGIRIELEKRKPFAKIAQETNTLAEIDTKAFVKTRVTEVIDGDTVIIESGERVRYIGVDTPETKHPKKSVQCFGREASRRNTELVEGKEVYLEKDISETDRYGRLLRYMYLPNPDAPDEVIMVNEYLIEQGYGTVITYPPDVKYHEQFLASQRLAQEEKRGLWGACK